MIVGYLTLALQEGVNNTDARNVIDRIASYAISHEAVDAVKCDVGILGADDEAAFWSEAEQA